MVIYLGIAVIVGSLVIGFLLDWDFAGGYVSLKKIILREEELAFRKVDKEGLVKETYAVWEACGFGEINLTNRIYVADQGTINRTWLFEQFKKLNWCNTIQSANESCGLREDIIPFSFDLPKVIAISCTTEGNISLTG